MIMSGAMKQARYTRHRPLLSDSAWLRLCSSRVAIAGAGGLGSHVLTALSRLGPMELELWDPGITDEPDLNRQVLYGPADVGNSKVHVAAQRLFEQNRELRITALDQEISLRSYARRHPPGESAPVLIFDCLDSFAARGGLADIQQAYQTPVLHAGVEAWYGQASTFLTPERSYARVFGPEFRNIPPADKPVFPHVVSALAAIQVAEFLGWCENPEATPLSDKLLMYDGRTSSTACISLNTSG